jgi:hypothetical protein
MAKGNKMFPSGVSLIHADCKVNQILLLDHLAAIAFCAISRRRSGVSFAARAFPPFNPPNRPNIRAAFCPSVCGIRTSYLTEKVKTRRVSS